MGLTVVRAAGGGELDTNRVLLESYDTPGTTGARSIPIDLSEYAAVDIQWEADASWGRGTHTGTNSFVVGGSSGLLAGLSYGHRTVTVTKDGITLGAAFYYGSGRSIECPRNIYGYKIG